METKYTEGEWEARGNFVYKINTSHTIANVITYDNNQIESKANAKVIAASKDLLEALISLVKKYEFNLNASQKKNIHLDEEYNNSINAINKATK